ncbi:MAG: hypothetical protein BroJett018_39840 [Chloroflexota bacterium]|nr:MAG: hypothetical protein BroJett018_39840 [Chloroflexota bacterium]
MTPEERLNLAADLIRKKEYASARAILITLDHPKAKEWLTRLDQMAPPPPQAMSYNPPPPMVAAKEKPRGGCLMSIVTGLAGLSLIWMVALACLVVLICGSSVALMVAVLGSLDSQSQTLIDNNNGYGTKSNPIPINTWAKFEGGQVRLTRDILDITQSAQAAEDPLIPVVHDDERYTMLYIELVCQQQECRPHDVSVSYIDSAGDEWDNSGSIYGFPEVGPRERLESVYRNGTTAGWVHIDFPPNVTALRLVKIVWEGRETLYFKVPQITVLEG